jgi:hypothetical protein
LRRASQTAEAGGMKNQLKTELIRLMQETGYDKETAKKLLKLEI